VRRQEHRVPLGRVPAEEPLGALLDDRVEVGERLVDEDDARLVDERLRDEHLLAFPLREVRTQRVEFRLEGEAVGPRPDPVVDRRLLEAARGRHEVEVLPHREEGGWPAVLREDADALAGGHRLRDGVDARHARRPRVGDELAGQDVDRRRLPGAVRPEEPVQLSRLHGEGEPVERRHVAVPLLEPVGFDRRVIAHPPPVRTRPAKTYPTARPLCSGPPLVKKTYS
jgi:hypothetical protein